MRLDLLKADGSKEATVEPGITLGDVHGRKSGEMAGLTFDPSKVTQPGLHTIRATLEASPGAKIFEYPHVFSGEHLNKRTAALEKTLELLPIRKRRAPWSAVRARHDQSRASNLLWNRFQNLTGYVFTGCERGLGLKEAMDFDSDLTYATGLASALRSGQDTLATARGDLKVAYRSEFDGKLVPYRVFVPTSYSRRKISAGGVAARRGRRRDGFRRAYQKLWPKLAEKRGYILASVSGADR